MSEPGRAGDGNADTQPEGTPPDSSTSKWLEELFGQSLNLQETRNLESRSKTMNSPPGDPHLTKLTVVSPAPDTTNASPRTTEAPQQRVEAPPVKAEQPYGDTDVTSSRAQLEELAAKNLNGAELEKFRADRQEFEKRSKELNLSPQEVHETYENISRLISGTRDTPLTKEKRLKVAEQIMSQAAKPTSINQGNHNTCGVAAIETRTYTRYPAEASKLVADVALTGHYQTPVQKGADGKDIPGSSVEVTVNPASLQEMNDAVPKPEQSRSLSSQVFQITAVNVHYAQENAKTNPPGQLRYEQVPVPPANADMDTGERIYDYATNPPTLKSKNSPMLTDDNVVEVSNAIVGKHEKGVLLVEKNNTFGDGRSINSFHSERDFEDYVARLKQQGKLPTIIRVDSNNEPFYTDSGGGKAGGSGGPHAVTITDYTPGKPPDVPAKVSVDDQWGPAADHLGQKAISVHDIYEAMHRSDDPELIAMLRKDVLESKRQGKVAKAKEDDLEHHVNGLPPDNRLKELEQERQEGLLNQEQYETRLTDAIILAHMRWYNQVRWPGFDVHAQNQEKEHTFAQLQELLKALPPNHAQLIIDNAQHRLKVEGNIEIDLQKEIYE